MKNITSVLGVLMVIASIAFLGWSFIGTRNYVDVTGTVVSVEFDPSTVSDPDEVTQDYKVILEYVVDNQTYTAEIYAQEHDYSVGQSVDMRYDPNNPQNNAVGKMSLPVLIGISAVALVIGALVFVKGRRIV